MVTLEITDFMEAEMLPGYAKRRAQLSKVSNPHFLNGVWSSESGPGDDRSHPHSEGLGPGYDGADRSGIGWSGGGDSGRGVSAMAAAAARE